MIERYRPKKRADGSSASKGYEVGYGKPPLGTRFRQGVSGNPKGRPKGLRNLKTDIQEALRSPITVSIGGKTRKISTQFAAVLRLIKKTMDGDPRAISLLLSLAQAYNDEEPAVSAGSSEDDLKLLAIFEDRVRRNATGSFAAVHASDASSEPSVTTAAEAAEPTPRKHKSIRRVRSKRR